MKYKALFLDIDGTTVELGGTEPTEPVTQAILRADALIHVCTATGRILSTALPVIDVLNLSGLCVISNGIQIYDPQGEKILQEISIQPDDVPFVLGVLRKYDLEIRYFDGIVDRVYSDELVSPKILSLYVENLNKEIAKKIIDDLTFLPEVSTHQMLTRRGTDVVGLEIAHVRATKQYGIAEVAKRLGISTHEIIGVGDGYNDFPLLMACGLKVAMGNAVPELKAIADFIAPTVEEDGVATVIEKFVLELSS